MTRDLSQVREDSEGESIGGEAVAAAEAKDLNDRRAGEAIELSKQNRRERKKYALRIFVLVCCWLLVIVALLFLQGFFEPRGVFSLSDPVLIAVATTTTASVTAILVIVTRSLFPKD